MAFLCLIGDITGVDCLKIGAKSWNHLPLRTIVTARRSKGGVNRRVVGAKRSAIEAKRCDVGIKRSIAGVKRCVAGVKRCVIGAKRSNDGVIKWRGILCRYPPPLK
jgi:hypothetical protein